MEQFAAYLYFSIRIIIILANALVLCLIKQKMSQHHIKSIQLTSLFKFSFYNFICQYNTLDLTSQINYTLGQSQYYKQIKQLTLIPDQPKFLKHFLLYKRMSRLSIYLITFLTYSVVHMMRVTYSFNKGQFQKIFGLNNLFLGFLDAFTYITLSIGTFLRYSIVNSHNPVRATFWTCFPAAIGYAIIPIYSLSYQSSPNHPSIVLTYFLFIMATGLFGFFQLNFFPAMLTIFGHSFDNKNDGRIVGVWSAKTSVGNILGFLMCNVLVYQLNVRWQVTMLVCSVLLVLMSSLLMIFIKNPNFGDQPKIQTLVFFRFFRTIWKSNQFKLYSLSLGFVKAVLYSYQLWTPKFLAQIGYKSYSGYIPIGFDASTLLGSFIMGHIYKLTSQKDSNDSSKHFAQKNDQQRSILHFINKYKFFIPSLCVVLVCFLYLPVPPSLVIQFVFGALMGFFLGSIYNSLSSSEILTYTQDDPLKIDMLSTITFGIATALVGISQFVIGVGLHIGSESGADQQLIKKGLVYVVIGCIAIISAIVALIRTCLQRKLHKQEQLHNDSNQMKQVLRKDSQVNDINESIQQKTNSLRTDQQK